MNSIKKFNTFSVNAHCNHIVEVRNEKVLEDIKSLIGDSNYTILGRGSNILFLGNYNGVILLNKLKGIEVVYECSDYLEVKAYSGEDWESVIDFFFQRKVYGLENLTSIPGSVGGAIVQNIGAYGREISEFCSEVTYYDLGSKEVITLKGNECQFGYRKSFFNQSKKAGLFIISATLRVKKNWQPSLDHLAFSKVNKDAISAEKIKELVAEIRSEKIPDFNVLGNAGSFFKNPIINKIKLNELLARYEKIPFYPTSDDNYKIAAAWLIDQAGLKGRECGCARVYEKQPLIIVTQGEHIDGFDIKSLSEIVVNEVDNKFGVRLEPEVKFIGELE